MASIKQDIQKLSLQIKNKTDKKAYSIECIFQDSHFSVMSATWKQDAKIVSSHPWKEISQSSQWLFYGFFYKY